MVAINTLSVIGQPVQAVEANEKVTGQTQFVYDIAFAGMLHAKVLRSPHPHARILHIETAAAARAPGVHAVVTGADLVGLNPTYGCEIKDQPVLAIDKVRYVGDIVAAVVAIDEASALRALRLINVTYEPLGSVMTLEAALADKAPAMFETPSPGVSAPLGSGGRAVREPAPNILYEYDFTSGDVTEALARADHIFEDTFVFSRMTHFHLEPHVVVARAVVDRVEVWSCNQDPYPLRQEIARIFNWPEHLIRIHTGFVGGGFGGKSFCKMEPLAVLLATKVARPVRLCFSLDEDFVTLSQHAAVLRLRTGVMADGTLVGRESFIDVNGGAYADASPMLALKVGYRVPGPYRWRAVASHVRCVRTTTVPAGSFRGFGGPQANWACESQIDMIARRLGIDPYALRMQNLLRLGEPYMPDDSGMDSELGEGLQIIAKRMGYHERPRTRGRGMGLAVGFKDAGGVGRTGHALVKVTTAGDVFVSFGTVDVGQGSTTAMALIASEVLTLPLSSVRVAPIDTDTTPLDQGTRGSCSLTVVGSAVKLAAEDARRQILECAADQLNVRATELMLDGWAVLHQGQRRELAPLLLKAFGIYGRDFIGQGVFQAPRIAGAALSAKVLFWLPSWCGAEVEVDEETGRIVVQKLLVGVDAGRIINLGACKGQVEGAALQALGQTLFERLIYVDERLMTDTPLTYRVPLATDLPAEFGCLLFEQGHGVGPFGAKGIGEGGMLAVAAAIANAVEDAVGARITELPLSPERVLAAIDATKPAGDREPVPATSA